MGIIIDRPHIVWFFALIVIALIASVVYPVMCKVSNDARRETAILEHDPNNYEALMKRGEAYYTVFDADASIKDFTRAIELRPKSGEAYRKRADAYEILKKKPALAARDRQAAAALEH